VLIPVLVLVHVYVLTLVVVVDRTHLLDPRNG